MGSRTLPSPACSYERERVAPPPHKHLPRLADDFYRGLAFVHWTLTVASRRTGWLNPVFHSRWELLLLHACSRHELVCATFVLMPDHIHMLTGGVNERGSDQRVALEFLRKLTRPLLCPDKWQHQTYDHVLREEERGGMPSARLLTTFWRIPKERGWCGTGRSIRILDAAFPGIPISMCETIAGSCSGESTTSRSIGVGPLAHARSYSWR